MLGSVGNAAGSCFLLALSALAAIFAFPDRRTFLSVKLFREKRRVSLFCSSMFCGHGCPYLAYMPTFCTRPDNVGVFACSVVTTVVRFQIHRLSLCGVRDDQPARCFREDDAAEHSGQWLGLVCAPVLLVIGGAQVLLYGQLFRIFCPGGCVGSVAPCSLW